MKYVVKESPFSSHGVIVSWLAQLPAGSRVLDVGAAGGSLGWLSQVRHVKMLLIGLEPNPEWAVKALPYYNKMLVAPLEAVDDESISCYQVVVLGDVLEHISDPDAALKRLVALQDSGTSFIVSVPNVANIWVRLNLVMGRFDYEERGLLDRTHLRFFTRTSFLDLLTSAGLEVEKLVVTPIPLDLVNRFFAANPIGRALFWVFARVSALFPTLLGFQFVAHAKKIV